MKRYSNYVIIGIDHGYGNIKTANTVTPTGITQLDSKPTFNRNILCYEGNYYLIGAIRNSEVKVYSAQSDLAPLIHEIRKIGTNLNQLAYYSNIGQEERVRAEIGNIPKKNDEVMTAVMQFLKNPKFRVKS